MGCKINCLTKQVPWNFIWVFLYLPLLYYVFPCHSFILFRGLKTNDLDWHTMSTTRSCVGAIASLPVKACCRIFHLNKQSSEQRVNKVVGPVKINWSTKQVPEYFIWVFLYLPLVYHVLFCHSFILFRGLWNNDLDWHTMPTTWGWVGPMAFLPVKACCRTFHSSKRAHKFQM